MLLLNSELTILALPKSEDFSLVWDVSPPTCDKDLLAPIKGSDKGLSAIGQNDTISIDSDWYPPIVLKVLWGKIQAFNTVIVKTTLVATENEQVTVAHSATACVWPGLVEGLACEPRVFVDVIGFDILEKLVLAEHVPSWAEKEPVIVIS